MLRVTCLLIIMLASTSVLAHHPDRARKQVHPRVELIPPVGNRLPPSHRRVYNRPSYVGGKIAYWIAPSSQEAMAWHRAEHINAYKCDLPRTENTYFYPKPWEALRVGPRKSRSAESPQDEAVPSYSDETRQDVGMMESELPTPPADTAKDAMDLVPVQPKELPQRSVLDGPAELAAPIELQ
ncbi:MAG: hypothetical protein AAGA03_11230 [Planctomycetota bacterium]